MTARWPSGRPTDAPQEAEAAVLAPIPEMTFEEAQERERRQSDELQAARRESEDATAALAAAKEGLSVAASQGFGAAQEAQRQIGEAESRLSAATAVEAALERAHRPVAERLHELTRSRTTERLALTQAAKLSERDGIDADLVAVLDQLASVTARREKATAEILAIRRTAAQGQYPLPHVEEGYPAATISRVVQSLGATICRALAS